MASEEILTCNFCGEQIKPPTLGAYLNHLESKHPEMTREIGTLKRLISIERKPGASSTEKCSYCGEAGHSIQQCPKWRKEMSSPSPLVFTVQHLDKLQRFRTFVDFPMFQRMYADAGGSFVMAGHLWDKLQGYGVDLIKWWSELDFENRERFIKMLNAWSGLVPLKT